MQIGPDQSGLTAKFVPLHRSMPSGWRPVSQFAQCPDAGRVGWPRGSPGAQLGCVDGTQGHACCRGRHPEPERERCAQATEVAEKLATFGFVPNPMTPAALASLIDSDIAAYAAMVKRTRISAD